MPALRAEITVDPRICQTIGEKLYSQSWETIWVRETQQNSLDAGADKVIYNTGTEVVDGKTLYWLSCQDNGCGMTPDTFINYFLKVGASYKPDSKDPIGGFGVAKLAILAGLHWRVISKHPDSGEFTFDDTMLGQEIEPSLVSYLPGRSGTFIKVWRDKPIQESKLKKPLICSRPRPGVSISLGLEKIKHLSLGRKFNGTGFGSFSSNKAQSLEHPGVHVRIKTKDGSYVYQFSYNIYSVKRCVFFDVDSDKLPPVQDGNYPFTASRESFTWIYSRVIDEQVEQITIDPVTMLRPQQPELLLEMLSAKPDICLSSESAGKGHLQGHEDHQEQTKNDDSSYELTYEDESGEVKNSRIKNSEILFSVGNEEFPILIYRTSSKQKKYKPENERRNIKVLRAMRAILNALDLEHIGIGLSLAPKMYGCYLRGLKTGYILVAPGHIPTRDKETMFRLILAFLSHELSHYYVGSYHNQQFSYMQYKLLQDFNSKQYDVLREAFFSSQER